MSSTKSGKILKFAALVAIAVLTYGFCAGRISNGLGGMWNLPSAKQDGVSEVQVTQKTGQTPQSKIKCAFPVKYKDRRGKNFTIVTAYFKLGSYKKGNEPEARGPGTYLDWMRPYRSIMNGVVAFFDDVAFAEAFAQLRQNRPTKIVMVDRSQLWAFSMLSRTSAVFMQDNYPKNSPKSTNAEYVAAMHAKYELLARAAQGDDPFRSTYIAWMDLGIYRELPRSETDEFMLNVHGCHRDEAILFSRVFPMSNDYTLESVMRDGNDWVGGGFFVARHDLAIRFFGDYYRSVEFYLNQSLANHDQSVLLAMYLPTTMPRPSVPMQVIVPPGHDQQWFHLAMQAREEGLAMQNTTCVLIEFDCSYSIHL